MHREDGRIQVGLYKGLLTHCVQIHLLFKRDIHNKHTLCNTRPVTKYRSDIKEWDFVLAFVLVTENSTEDLLYCFLSVVIYC